MIPCLLELFEKQYLYPADTILGSIKCHSCIADSNIPRKCTRDEFQGTYIKCPVDDPVNNPVNTCYKSVHRVTGGEKRASYDSLV